VKSEKKKFRMSNRHGWNGGANGCNRLCFRKHFKTWYAPDTNGREGLAVEEIRTLKEDIDSLKEEWSWQIKKKIWQANKPVGWRNIRNMQIPSHAQGKPTYPGPNKRYIAHCCLEDRQQRPWSPFTSSTCANKIQPNWKKLRVMTNERAIFFERYHLPLQIL